MFVLYSNVPQPNDSKPMFFKSHSDLQEFLSTLHKDFPVKVLAVTEFDAYYEGYAGDCIQYIDNEVEEFMHEFHEGQLEYDPCEGCEDRFNSPCTNKTCFNWKE